MSLKSKLLLLIAVSIAASVGAVTFLIEERAHEAFRQVEQERTATMVGQFHREFDHEGEEITRGVETIANSDSMLRTAMEITNGADVASFLNEAANYAQAQRLDFLDLIAPDGTIISSAHWPARFGYKERWFLDRGTPLPQQAFLKHVETPQGTVLALLCLRPVRTHGLSLYLIGGRRLDAILQTLAPPSGLRVSIYSAPEQGPGEILGPAKDNLGLAKVMPLVQQAIEQHEASMTLNWGPGLPQEEIVHAIALAGYSDRVPAVLLVGNSLEQELSLEKRIRNISLVIAGVAVFIGIVISGILTARMSRPIKDLAKAAGEIGQGNWDVRVEPASQDEIGKLAAAFNHMTGELAAQRERLVQTERVAAWRELARRLAHELKNPLFPLQITVENLLRARENTPDQFDEVFRESTATLLGEITNLKTIINRFSDFSKMPAPQLQPVDMEELVRSVVQLFQGQLTSGPKKIEPELLLEKVPPVSADPVLLRRVIENLVLNAIDAMPDGGKLTFHTAKDDKFAVFELTDTGKGLTPEECDRIFTPYYTTKQHGTGLGLAIVQSLVSDHHGRISVRSKKEQGTTFHVELPLASGQGVNVEEKKTEAKGTAIGR
ncbi:MAG TPA: ATP-binding protein [Candidatus Limnocylindrales bacterium]|nr:ATP-binding protein [Candidatus Limnocylindrales bacterium]